MATVRRVAGPLWSQLSSQLQYALVSEGLDNPSYFCRLFCGPSAEVAALGQEMGGVDGEGELLLQIRVALSSLAAAGHPRAANFTMPEAAAHAHLLSAKRSRVGILGAETKVLQAAVAIKSSKESWPTGQRRSSDLVWLANARQVKEERTRDKWLVHLHHIVMVSSLPVVHISSQLSDPSMILHIIGKGRRAATIRRRVLDWRSFARFLQLSYGRVWPDGPAQVLDYLASLVDGGCGKSVVDRANSQACHRLEGRCELLHVNVWHALAGICCTCHRVHLHTDRRRSHSVESGPCVARACVSGAGRRSAPNIPAQCSSLASKPAG